MGKSGTVCIIAPKPEPSKTWNAINFADLICTVTMVKSPLATAIQTHPNISIGLKYPTLVATARV